MVYYPYESVMNHVDANIWIWKMNDEVISTWAFIYFIVLFYFSQMLLFFYNCISFRFYFIFNLPI